MPLLIIPCCGTQTKYWQSGCVSSVSYTHLDVYKRQHQIYEAIWRKDSEHCGTAVASVIGQIRRKLTPDTPKGGYIRTVLGSGYKFNSSPF